MNVRFELVAVFVAALAVGLLMFMGGNKNTNTPRQNQRDAGRVRKEEVEDAGEAARQDIMANLEDRAQQVADTAEEVADRASRAASVIRTGVNRAQQMFGALRGKPSA